VALSSQGTPPAKGLCEATVLRETCLLFARWTASISIVEWTIALSFFSYWTLVRDNGNPPGSPGAVRSLIAACWTGQMQTRPNNENGPEYKAIPGPENTLPTIAQVESYKGRAMS
jgi:hypothetical protein